MSKFNQYRNVEIKDLVWGKNPFLTRLDSLLRHNIPSYGRIDGLSFIGTWEKLCGLEPMHTTPRIYYQPVLIPALADTTIVDLTAISLRDVYGPFASKVLAVIPKDSVRLTYANGSYAVKENALATYGVANIRHLCNVLFSAKEVYMLHSGASCLASAIAHLRPNLSPPKVLIPRGFYEHSKSINVHIYPNLEYIPI